jgi:hypothetical protein
MRSERPHATTKNLQPQTMFLTAGAMPPDLAVLSRGVWREPYRSASGEVLLAPVTSAGLLATGHAVPVRAHESEDQVASSLWDVLDEMDPQPGPVQAR